VPFLVVDGPELKSLAGGGEAVKFCERLASAAGWHLDSGAELFRMFIHRV
jgi:hypothetical protein